MLTKNFALQGVSEIGALILTGNRTKGTTFLSAILAKNVA
jgi:hypothetical protein